MGKIYTDDELNKLSKRELILIIISMQGQIEKMNDNLEKLIEQISIANQHRFGPVVRKKWMP
ncbi:MAG: hypothetical protein LBB91_02205 [Clostridiales bacterium]|jgi:hypothetical protein|nr:hypothetical protein [Clostridiales bacterium]